MITVVNKSTLVSSVDVQTMTRTIAYQLRYHAAPVWGKLPIPVVYSSTEQDAPAGSWVVEIFDDFDHAGDLGYHTETQGEVIYGRVFARPVLDNGGDALSKPLSVASVLSHECLEILVDPHVNLWADNGNGTATALEVGDPVESDSYKIGSVTVSNFATPAWFDPQAKPGDRFDWLGTVTAAFQMSNGGYVVTLAEGQVKQVLGESYPAWRRATKQTPLSRTARRAQEMTPIMQVTPPEKPREENAGLLHKLTERWSAR